MKFNNIKMKRITLVLGMSMFSIVGCKDDFLEPDPLSFYTPGNGLNTPEGMYSVLSQAMTIIRSEFNGDAAPLITENIFSEVAVEGTTDKTGPAQDLNLLILPDANLNSTDWNRIGWYWDNWYVTIKYANTVLSRIDGATYSSDAQKNAIMGAAYFYRAYSYYRLTHQFGDVPAVMTEAKAPKLDFKSTARLTILEKMKTELEQAVAWLPVTVNKGEVSKGAALHLLTKVNLALAKFDDAIASADQLINSGIYALMTTRFGSDKANLTRNITWDLHRPENKSLPENKEAILNVISRLEFVDGAGSATTLAMRNAVPLWWRFILTPNGANGMSDSPDAEIKHVATYGRGIGRNRATPYSTKFIWKDANDLRHKYPNWIRMEDITYNNPTLKTTKNSYYNQPLQLRKGDGTVLCTDTIRNWFDFPLYKLFIPDPQNVRPQGGYSDWYVFRLAETYLLRAEAQFWKGNLAAAALDINRVRSRANAADMLPSAVTIGSILDERARELYYEEPRNTELTRIAFILAQTGKPAYNGKTYSLANFHQNNFWYDRIMESTTFYNKGVKTIHGDSYTMSPYHALFPVPASAINANTQGRINQNLGYPGSANNIEPLTKIE
jgi:starch-binding outer membrane protein, SusD/RagB family